MNNEEAANKYIELIGLKLQELLASTDIADEDFVDTLEMVNDDISILINEIHAMKIAVAEIVMLEEIFDKSWQNPFGGARRVTKPLQILLR